MRSLLGAVLSTVVLAGCSAPAQTPVAAPAPTEIPASLELPAHPTGQAWRALALVPADATVVTITDFDAMRARFGVPDLTSEDLMADRSAFWERARAEGVLFTDGLLRDDHSRFWLDHGFTEDDVDWEVRFTGPRGSGYVVAFRPGLDMTRVAAARREKALTGATVMTDEHLLVKGVAAEGEPVWAADPALPDLTDERAESAYLRRGCIPVRTALGDDATAEHQATLIGELDPRNLDELTAFSVSFSEGLATARLGESRGDLIARGKITEAWPRVTTAMGFADGFRRDVLNDPSTGRIGLRTKAPQAAAAVTVADLLPFAICDAIEPWEEPTGL
ncbi:hypothetical protein [Nocardioides sp.]|uniref:hypothetical protein n=1 Tax=Nocardioides sp. TaxID=35761 RepID=UPI002CBDE9F8|nr:hypothetical protein [Nocardioides sp.]HSX67314.1 hypothetical protein [Nocardioides sp.]